jgi:hypothetical protein
VSEKNKKIAPPTEIEKLIAALPIDEQEKLLSQVADYKSALEREQCQKSFMAFVKKMWPGFIHGRHHAVVAKAFEDIAAGKLSGWPSLCLLGTRSRSLLLICCRLGSWGTFPARR